MAHSRSKHLEMSQPLLQEEHAVAIHAPSSPPVTRQFVQQDETTSARWNPRFLTRQRQPLATEVPFISTFAEDLVPYLQLLQKDPNNPRLDSISLETLAENVSNAIWWIDLKTNSKKIGKFLGVTALGAGLGAALSYGACLAVPYYIQTLLTLINPQISIAAVTVEGASYIAAIGAGAGGTVGCCIGVCSCCRTKENNTERNLRSLKDVFDRMDDMRMTKAAKVEVWQQALQLVHAAESQASHAVTVRPGGATTG